MRQGATRCLPHKVTVTYRVPTAGTWLDFKASISNASPGPCFYADDAPISLG